MEEIKERFKAKADTVSAEIKQMLKEHGNKVVGEVTLAQIYQGMRGITGLVTETSLLDSVGLSFWAKTHVENVAATINTISLKKFMGGPPYINASKLA